MGPCSGGGSTEDVASVLGGGSAETSGTFGSFRPEIAETPSSGFERFGGEPPPASAAPSLAASPPLPGASPACHVCARIVRPCTSRAMTREGA